MAFCNRWLRKERVHHSDRGSLCLTLGHAIETQDDWEKVQLKIEGEIR